MTERTMKGAMTQEEYERWDKGLPPLPQKKEPEPAEPEPPKVDNLLSLDKLELEKIGAVLEGRRKGIRNKDGVMFVGFNVTMKMRDEMGKDGKIIPGKQLSGWMTGADFHKFRRILFRKGEVPLNNVEM